MLVYVLKNYLSNVFLGGLYLTKPSKISPDNFRFYEEDPTGVVTMSYDGTSYSLTKLF